MKTKPFFTKRQKGIFFLFILLSVVFGFIAGTYFSIGMMTKSVETIARVITIEHLEVGFNESALVEGVMLEMERRGIINATDD